MGTSTTTVNIHEAKKHLSRLVDQAAKGHGFVIAKAGKRMVCVIPIEAPPVARALGFLAGKGVVTADVRDVFKADIETMFGAVP